MRILACILACSALWACDATRRDDWSCAAYCVASLECNSNGDNKIDAELKTSQADTAANAFWRLAQQCDRPYSLLVTHLSCSNGLAHREPASVATSCADDR